MVWKRYRPPTTKAGGLPLPILDVELKGEAFEKLHERMGGTEVECLLRIKKTPNA